MVSKLLASGALMALCVVIHAGGVTAAVRWLTGLRQTPRTFWAWNWLFIRLAGWIILLHLVEITAWAWLYAWRQAMPDLPAGLYFSAVTYTTTGYGDLVLPGEWRLVGGIEALTGILMCGWSTGFFFAIFGKMFEMRGQAGGAAPPPGIRRA